MTSNESPAGRDPGLFRPSASLELLQLRSQLLEFTRAYFRHRGLWEVETPLLSRDIVVDAYLEPVHHRGRTVEANVGRLRQTKNCSCKPRPNSP